ncbi:MAG TPA: hypothetical protein VGD27_18300 [Longimicrobiales bacterium]
MTLLAMCMVVAAACDDSPTSQTENGTLRVTVSGHNPAGPNAGQVRHEGPLGPIVVTVPTTGMVEQEVPVGTYRIVYTPPQGHVMADGQTIERDMTVTAGGVATENFQVVPSATTGTLRITVTGHGSDGGSAQVLRTDLQGQTAISVTIPQSGSVDMPVVSGTYRITYAAPGGYQLSAGQTNPQNVTVSANQTATATFAVTQLTGGGTADVLFFSDFRTALGTSSAAVTDGGKWNVQATTPETMRIVSSAGLGFPSSNVMEMIATPERQGFAIIRKTGMPTPAVGESRYYRWYIRVMQPDNLSDYNTHPIQDGNAASQTNWMFLIIGQGGPGNVPAGHYQPEFWAESSPYPHQRWFGPDLPKNQTFRFELQIYRANATQFQMHVRVYDSAGTLVADDDDFQAYDVGTRLSTNPLFPFTAVQNMDGLNAGNNGIANMPSNSFTHSYQGAFAVCTNTWCGPYNGNY